MVTGGGWDVALVAATAIHADFQLTVSCLVYPALSEVPTESWTRLDAQHSRRIVPLVAIVYLAVLGTSVGALLSHPVVLTVVAVGASAVVLGVTALVAAPLHGRLAVGRDPELIRRLLCADRIRTTFAVTSLAAALWAVLV